MGFFFNNRAFVKRLIIILLTLIIILLLVLGRCSLGRYPRIADVFNGDNNDYGEYIVRRGLKSDNVLSFSCVIDGWGNENIDKMLDIFDKFGVKITFFVTGKWVDEYPGIAKKLSARGHEIGSLGYTGKPYGSMCYQQIYEDMQKGRFSLKEAVGQTTDLFSPPSGIYSEDVVKAAIDAGYPGIVLYSIDSEDRKNNGSDMQPVIFNKLGKGDIILIHPTKTAAESLSKIIEELLAQNYKILPIGEMLKK